MVFYAGRPRGVKTGNSPHVYGVGKNPRAGTAPVGSCCFAAVGAGPFGSIGHVVRDVPVHRLAVPEDPHFRPPRQANNDIRRARDVCRIPGVLPVAAAYLKDESPGIG